MKTLTTLIAAWAILMACDAVDPVSSAGMGPSPRRPDPRPTSSYALTGLVRDQNGVPLPGAKAEILGGPDRSNWGQSAITDAQGLFTLKGVWGDLWVQVGKAGHHASVETYSVTSDTQVAVLLLSATLPGAPVSDSIQVGKTIRGITNQPPCDPVHWDARSPCRRYDFVSPEPATSI